MVTILFTRSHLSENQARKTERGIHSLGSSNSFGSISKAPGFPFLPSMFCTVWYAIFRVQARMGRLCIGIVAAALL